MFTFTYYQIALIRSEQVRIRVERRVARGEALEVSVPVITGLVARRVHDQLDAERSVDLHLLDGREHQIRQHQLYFARVGLLFSLGLALGARSSRSRLRARVELDPGAGRERRADLQHRDGIIPFVTLARARMTRPC